jgi:hypothetical protein
VEAARVGEGEGKKREDSAAVGTFQHFMQLADSPDPAEQPLQKNISQSMEGAGPGVPDAEAATGVAVGNAVRDRVGEEEGVRVRVRVGVGAGDRVDVGVAAVVEAGDGVAGAPVSVMATSAQFQNSSG